jgi:hypothetical protein
MDSEIFRKPAHGVPWLATHRRPGWLREGITATRCAGRSRIGDGDRRSTLYPLPALETQGLLESEWRRRQQIINAFIASKTAHPQANSTNA